MDLSPYDAGASYPMIVVWLVPVQFPACGDLHAELGAGVSYGDEKELAE